jgi:hypothetical protein
VPAGHSWHRSGGSLPIRTGNDPPTHIGALLEGPKGTRQLILQLDSDGEKSSHTAYKGVSPLDFPNSFSTHYAG